MIHIFGDKGWIGSHFRDLVDEATITNSKRDDYVVVTNQIIDFISTTDNYNVYSDPLIDINTNLVTLIKMLESWRKYLGEYGDFTKPRKVEPGVWLPQTCFNFVSSWYVYGNEYSKSQKLIEKFWDTFNSNTVGIRIVDNGDSGGARETDVCNPKGFYSITKRTAEQLLISYCETYQLPYRILRLANVIGTGDKKTSKKKNALVYLINEMKENRDIELYENGEFTRDYIDIIDCVEAIKLVLKKGEKNAIYNIGSGRPYIFGDLINWAHLKLGSTSKITAIKQKDFHKQVQSLDFYMNTDKLKSLGFKQSIPIHDTLQRIIED